LERDGPGRPFFRSADPAMLQAEIPVGAGTDATRVASYDSWISLYWMVTGKTVGGLQLASPDNNLVQRRGRGERSDCAWSAR
jgi:predicted amidohydrolase YtcJ